MITWYDMDRPSKMAVVKNMAEEGLSSKQMSEVLGCPAKRIQDFMRLWKIKGLPRGGRPGNQSALIHGYGRNTIMRHNQKAVKDRLYICEGCGLNSSTPLAVHHKDGNHYDNEIFNLQVLCQSCHAEHHSFERARDERGRFA